MFEPIEQDETKATSQHQITIPKRIWDKLGLKPGIRFKVVLTDQGVILVRPRREEPDWSDEEWAELFKLAYSKGNVSKRFKDVKKALSYLERL